MANSKPLQIINELKTQLETMSTGAGNNHTVAKVIIGRASVARIAQYPFLEVSALDSSEVDYSADGNMEQVATFGVMGHLGAGAEHTDLLNLIEDIIDVIHGTERLGLSFVIDTKMSEWATDELMEISSGSSRMVAVTFDVSFEAGFDSF